MARHWISRLFARSTAQRQRVSRVKPNLVKPNLVSLEDRVVPTVFSNPSTILVPQDTILGLGKANPYPSTITASGLAGVVKTVTVTLNDFSHTATKDVDLLLVGPTGKAVVLMSDAGGSGHSVLNLSLTFDDSASGPVPNGFGSGTYQPTDINDGPDNWPGFSGAISTGLNKTFRNTNGNGTWSLYIVDDEAGDIGQITSGWSIDIFSRVNAAPVGVNDTYSTLEDGGTLSVSKSNGVLLGAGTDLDSDGDTLSAVLISGPTNGTLLFNSDGSFDYTPFPNFFGNDFFFYAPDDGFVQGSPAKVTIVVQPVDDAPIGVNDFYVTNKATKLSRPASLGVLSNDLHADVAPRVTLLNETFENFVLFDYTTESVTNGWAANTPYTNDWTDQLPAGWKTTATLMDGVTKLTAPPVEFQGWKIHNIDSWHATDPQGRNKFFLGDPGKGGQILVADSDEYADGPTGNSTRVRFTLTTRPIDLRGVIENSAKLEFDSSFRNEGTGPDDQNGYLRVSYDGGATFTTLFTLDNTYTGGNNFTKTSERLVFNLNNPVGATSAILQFDYDGTNDWWWAIDDVLVTGNRTERTGLTATLASSPTNGSLIFNADGSFEYTPNPTFTGTEIFTYTLSDGLTTTAPITVSILVRNGNPNLPVANADDYFTFINTPIQVVSNFGVLANDSDDDGDPLSAVLVTGPTLGTVSLNPDGSFLYTPGFGNFGKDHFTYQANDAFGNSNTAKVNITIISTPPEIISDGGGPTASFDLNENTAAPVLITTVQAFDPDPGQTISYSISGGPDKAFFSIEAGTGKLFVTKALNFEIPADLDENNSYVVVVRATDSAGAFDEQTITVNVLDVPETFELVSDGGGSKALVKVSEHTRGVTRVRALPEAGTSYVIVGGADAAKFSLNPVTGILTFNTAPDFEIPTDTDFDNDYLVNVQAVNGSNIIVQSLTVRVLDVVGEEGAYPDFYSTDKATTLNVAAPGVLANDNTRITLYSEGFEGFTLKPFRTSTRVGAGDGTDFTDLLPVGFVRVTTDIDPDPNTPGSKDLSTAANPIEFRGWTILDVDSWNATAGQGRNSFTKGGVGKNGSVLVADGDEFDDGPPNGTNGGSYRMQIDFPQISLAGVADNTAKLEFDSSFRPEGSQTGIVQYSLDGGPFVNLLVLDTAYTGGPANNFNKANETISLSIPNVGNSTLDLRMLYFAGNNWWWAIDNVVVTGQRAGFGAPSAVLVSGPANGTLVGGLNANGSFTYDPNPSFAGTDFFTYKVSDGVGFTRTTKVSIDVLAPRDITWTGAISNLWDINTTANWLNGGATTYKQGDNPLFNDVGLAKNVVQLDSTVLPGPVTFDTTGTYTIQGTGKISGSSGLSVVNGTVILATNNNYSGSTAIAAGSTLKLGSGGASGSVAGPIVNQGNLVFHNTGTFIYGSLSGTGSLTQLGTGTTILTGPATPSGTTIQAGTLRITDINAIGTGPLTFTNVANAATFQLYTNGTFTNPITLAAPTAAQTTNLLTDVVAGVGLTPVYSGKITGGNTNNRLFLNLSASNNSGGPTFTNPNNDFTVSKIQLNRGKLGVGANGALGNPANLVFLDVTRSGAGQELTGLHFTADNITLPNPVQFADYTNINITGFKAHMSGNIVGSSGSTAQPFTLTGGQLIGDTSQGVLTFSGTNSFIHPFRIFPHATLVAASPTALGTAAGKTTVDAGATLAFSSVGAYANAEPLFISGNGVLAGGVGVGAIRNQAGANSFPGPITLQANSRIAADAGSLTLTGSLSGAFDLEIAGNGAVYLNGSSTNNALTVLAGATLGGIGTLPATSVLGRLTAGTDGGTGTLSTGNLAVSGFLRADLLAVGDGDQVSVTGSVDISGSTLQVNAPNPLPNGTQFTIINNDTNSDPVIGKFVNLPAEGDTITAGPNVFTISYVGGDGNDVVLTRTAAAAPSVTSIQVNNGAVQRSRLTSITVTFAGPVSPASFTSLGAITLTRTSATPSGTVGTIVQTGATGANGLISVAQPGPSNQLVLTFSNANAAAETAGVEFGSLADGRWQLAIPSAAYLSTLNDPILRRLFGDFENGPPANSNGTVDSNDFGDFGTVFGTSPGLGVSPFDYDNNGTIDSLDFAAFGARFGLSL